MAPACSNACDSNRPDKPLAVSQVLELIDRAEAVVGIRKGLASMARGEGIPAEKAFDELRKKHNIPRRR
jgi:hypothetical protein